MMELSTKWHERARKCAGLRVLSCNLAGSFSVAAGLPGTHQERFVSTRLYSILSVLERFVPRLGWNSLSYFPVLTPLLSGSGKDLI